MGLLKNLKAGFGLLRGTINMEDVMDFITPLLTPENIANMKQKVVEFAALQNAQHGGKLMLVVEMTAEGNDVALSVYRRNELVAGGLELYKQYFLSQITPANITELGEQFRKIKLEVPQHLLEAASQNTTEDVN